MKSLPLPEPLEARIAPASAVALALDLPSDTTVDVSAVKRVALGVANDFSDSSFGMFPTGSNNNSFVIMSTGDATKARYSPYGGYSPHGLDFGPKGTDGDFQTMKMTIPVAPGASHLRFEFRLFTNEEPGPTNVFNDSFKVTVTSNAAGNPTTNLVDLGINDVLYLSEAPTTTIYKNGSALLTPDYRIPAGTTSLNVEFQLADAHDGTGDTAVFMDNFRFQNAQRVVWLNFEGGTSRQLGPGISAPISAFQPADIGSAAARATLIADITNQVAAKFADFDIQFVTTQPTSGDYSTVLVGGDDDDPVIFNTNPMNGPVANPIFVAGLPPNPSFKQAAQARGNLLGRAQSVDLGDKNLNEEVVIFSETVGSFSASNAVDPQGELVVAIAHELGHILGARHVDASFSSNIMAKFAPINTSATFEDISRALPEFWIDKLTEQNTHSYLTSVLGSSSDSALADGTSQRAAATFFTLVFPIPVFNVNIGVLGKSSLADDDDTPVTWMHFDQLNAGPNFIQLDAPMATTQIAMFASSTNGGTPDLFTGTPTGGNITPDETFVPLLDPQNGDPFARGLVSSLPISMGAPGALVAQAPLTVQRSFFTADFEGIPAKGFVFQDTDGDTVTVKLTSKNGFGVIRLNDPDNDGKGAIAEIQLQNTSAKDKLEISVKKNKDTGDGFIDVGRIAGGALGTLSAKNANFVGDGILFGDAVGTITIRDVENGADIFAGGTFETKTKLTARDIADGTDIDVDGQLKLTALRIGVGKIEAALLGQLAVKGDSKLGIQGDFESDITIVPGKLLNTKELKMNLLAGVAIAGRAMDVDIVVPGNVGTFKTGTFEHSSLLVAYTALTPGDPFAGGVFNRDVELASFKATGIKDSMLPAFQDSVVIAGQLGAVTLASVDTDNSGTLFGFAARNGLAKNIATIVVNAPEFKYDKKSPLPQASEDFTVKLI